MKSLSALFFSISLASVFSTSSLCLNHVHTGSDFEELVDLVLELSYFRLPKPDPLRLIENFNNSHLKDPGHLFELIASNLILTHHVQIEDVEIPEGKSLKITDMNDTLSFNHITAEVTGLTVEGVEADKVNEFVADEFGKLLTAFSTKWKFNPQWGVEGTNIKINGLTTENLIKILKEKIEKVKHTKETHSVA